MIKDKICEVWYNDALVLTGKDIGPGGLCILPIDGRASLDKERPAQERQNPPSIGVVIVHMYLAVQTANVTCYVGKGNE